MNKLLLALSYISVALLVSGCASTKTPKPVSVSCAVSDYKRLDDSIRHAKSQLSNRSCHYQYDAFHRQLLATAQGDTGAGNAEKFLDFYKWSVDQGIVSKRQGMEYYNSYFKPSFGNVLPNDRNVCSAVAVKDDIEKRMYKELEHKRIGLQEIMGDREAYFEAQRVHNDLVFLLETSNLACGNG